MFRFTIIACGRLWPRKSSALQVGDGRCAKHALILPTELRRACVAHVIRHAGDIGASGGEKLSGFQQAYMTLEGQGAKSRDSLEVPVKRGDAHAGRGRQLGNDNRFVVIGGKPVGRRLELLEPVVSPSDLPKRIAHRALQQTIIELELVVWRERADVIGRGQKSDKANKCIADRSVQIV